MKKIKKTRKNKIKTFLFKKANFCKKLFFKLNFKGVSLLVEFSPPDQCDDDKICSFIKEHLKSDLSLKLNGVFSADGVKMAVDYPGTTPLTETITMKDIQLSLNIEGIDSNVFIKVSLILKDPPLKFTGIILLKISKCVLNAVHDTKETSLLVKENKFYLNDVKLLGKQFYAT